MYEVLNYINYTIVTILSYPVVIQIAIFFILINFFLGLVFYVGIIITRKLKRGKEKNYFKNEEEIKEFIMSAVLDPNTLNPDVIREDYQDCFGNIDKKRFGLFVEVLELLVDENKEIKNKPNYWKIISAFDVVNQFENKLNFTSTKKRVRIFQTLSKLSLQIADSKILPYTHSKNNALRKEARIAYIGVSNNDPFKFFNQKSKNTLSEWEQISLTNQFKEHHSNSLPDFGKWIKYSEEPTQKLFFIKLASKFNQRTCINILVDLLNTECHLVRKEAILALGNLNVIEAEEKIKDLYFSQPSEVQIAIINYINALQSGKSLGFLKHIYKNTLTLELKHLIVEAIYLYQGGGKILFRELYEKEQGFNKLIFEHVNNKLISGRLRKTNHTSQIKKNIPKTRTTKSAKNIENELVISL